MLSSDNQTEFSGIRDGLARYLDDDAPALSLPPNAYSSTELWELERDRIFDRSWILVAHIDQLAETGDYVSLSIAGEPVIVARGEDGQLCAMSAICRHRMMPLVEPGIGHAAGFVCSYHKWRYGLNGQLRGAPYMAGNQAFDPAQCRLPAFAVSVWSGFVWVNLDADARPAEADLDMAAADVANYRLDEMVQIDAWRHEWCANWKLVLENAHENYHVLGLHPQTLQPIMPAGGDMDVRRVAPWVLRAKFPLAFQVEPESLALTDDEKIHAVGLLTFPSGVLIGIGDQLVWMSFIPLTIDRVQVLGGVLTTPELASRPDTYALAQQTITAMINDEDRIGLEAVQRTITSRFAQRGHLSPKEQPGIMAFYQSLANALLR